jgi:hypothetical protein
MKALRKYRHCALAEAEAACKAGLRGRYKVTTINWTYATVAGKQDSSQVHRNEYSFTLRSLVGFIRDLEHVAESIISIEVEAGPRGSPADEPRQAAKGRADRLSGDRSR